LFTGCAPGRSEPGLSQLSTTEKPCTSLPPTILETRHPAHEVHAEAENIADIR
jgi:hypothetical protein